MDPETTRVGRGRGERSRVNNETWPLSRPPGARARQRREPRGNRNSFANFTAGGIASNYILRQSAEEIDDDNDWNVPAHDLMAAISEPARATAPAFRLTTLQRKLIN
ncbi:hypothetical protein EVAR_99455_1 [Eumeta japonica]|uniref:Uncharacterized protein n=1 Tax=Eumeta variegata TaxID=151549 RepID=A0A4C2A924_EUMVA|nr:hypothetical protein EVAR_99455_1 [Eumeta japonica]